MGPVRRANAQVTARIGVLEPHTIWVLGGGGFFWPVWSLLALIGSFVAHAWVAALAPSARGTRPAALTAGK